MESKNFIMIPSLAVGNIFVLKPMADLNITYGKYKTACKKLKCFINARILPFGLEHELFCEPILKGIKNDML